MVTVSVVTCGPLEQPKISISRNDTAITLIITPPYTKTFDWQVQNGIDSDPTLIFIAAPMPHDCQECGNEIPAARVRITKSNLCVDCAEMNERLGLAPRYKMEIVGSGDTDNFEISQTFLTKTTRPRFVEEETSP